MGIGRLRLVVALAACAVAACVTAPAALDRLYDRALDQMRRGQVDEALQTAMDGATRADGVPDALRAWRFRLLAADALLTKLEVPAAMAVLEQAVPDGSGFEAIRGRQFHLLARAKVTQGQLSAAEPLIDQAMPLASGDPALRSDLELLESQVLYRSGRAADADALLAGTRARVATEGDPYRLAQVSLATGMGLVTRSRFDEALPFFESVVSNRMVEGTVVQGQALNNAGLCHARLGQFDRAVALQEQAIQVQARGRKQNYVQALGELGATYLLQDDFVRGAEHLQKAFDVAAGAGLATEASLFASNLAMANVALARWDDAERFNEAATRFGAQASRPRSPYTTINQAQIALGRGNPADAMRLFRAVLETPGVTPDVEWTAHDGLARVAIAEGHPRDARAHFETALERLEQTRGSLVRADYRISFTSRLRRFYRAYVDLLLDEGQVERALEVADASRARVLAERQNVAGPRARVSAAAMKQLARRTRSTLVFYWLGPDRSRAWVVAGDRIIMASLPAAATIEALVTEHQNTIQNALADPLAITGGAGDRLFGMLVGPLAAELPSDGAVVIVPDGALHQLNFETLPVPGPDRHYWIDDVVVQIAPSLALLSARRGAASAPSQVGGTDVPPLRTLLLVGNAAPRPPEFPTLSYAPTEMRQISQHFPSDAVSVLDGERASPAAFTRAEPGRYSVIHFTSHAVANIENPLDSAVILSGPDQGYKLYARDVAALPLTAELVTVSACRSAGERAYAGEGLVGFAWAFLRAGSRRVIAGLWDVDDRSTATLMGDVYRRIASGETPAAALREAKRALIRDGYPKPYHWAPFQLFTVVL